MSHVLRVLPMAVLLVLAGCSESPSGTATPAAAPTASAPAATPAPTPAAAPVVAAPVAADTGGTVTGVPECDAFLTAYERCVTEHVPAEARAAMQSGLVQWKQSWTAMAADPNTRAAMPQMCAQAQTSSAPGLQAYGCTF